MKRLASLLFLFVTVLVFTFACKKTSTVKDPVDPGSVTDIDGNVYKTIKIGKQVWMAENLKVTSYNDGTPINYVTDASQWSSLTNGAYCVYDNNEALTGTYGYLYNWYAVNTKKIAPPGWSVPTEADMNQLEDYLIANGYNYDKTTTGNKIAKSLASRNLWSTSDAWGPITTAGAIGNDPSKNNESGFSALPGGYRQPDGDFVQMLSRSQWWTSTSIGDVSAGYYDLNTYYEDYSYGAGDRKEGDYIRLIMK